MVRIVNMNNATFQGLLILPQNARTTGEARARVPAATRNMALVIKEPWDLHDTLIVR